MLSEFFSLNPEKARKSNCISNFFHSNVYFSLSLASSKECAKAFHAAGSKLVLCGRDSEKLKDLVQQLSTMTNHRKNVSVGEGKACLSHVAGISVHVITEVTELLVGYSVEQ